MASMRTTVRIDDDLLSELKEQARKENISLNQLLNRILRADIKASPKQTARRRRYWEKTYAMGTPRVDLDKALALAANLGDEEILRKMMLRK